jgi:hypothetical protein
MMHITGQKAGFYSLIGLLNLAVGVMFYVINIAPTPVLASPQIQPKPVVTVKAIAATQGIPIRVTVPSLNIDLPVAIGSYNPDDGNWTVDATQAYFADASMPVNNSNGIRLFMAMLNQQYLRRCHKYSPMLRPSSPPTPATHSITVTHPSKK